MIIKSVTAVLAICIAIEGMAAPTRADQVITVEGIEAKAEILIDRWGVPHIYAARRRDAFFAQGWNAARDRLWQIDMWRRRGLGELAAVLGQSYVAQDRAIRHFVYRGSMSKEWLAYGPYAKGDIEAFVAGINTYVLAAKRDAQLMPLEFKLAGYEPVLWHANDVVRIRHLGVARGALFQLMRAQLVCRAQSVAAAELLIKISPPWTPVTPTGLNLCSIPPNVLEQYQLAQRPLDFGRRDQPVLVESGFDISSRTQGSNNWVIAPTKSTTGRAILANDPHRSLDIPSLRYLAHIVAPGINVIGAGEPALPGISIGHNEHIAFGFTVFPIAQEDLYVYEINPSNSNEYRYGSGWERMQVVQERVLVRGGSAVETQLKFTRHGPVVLEDPANYRAYAVRATWLDTGAAPYLGSMRYLSARNVKQFASALKHWGQPGENHLYADTQGTIGWFAAGFTPIRPNSDGLLPLPGDGQYEWEGYLDRDLLPSEVNPSRGYIATANQMNLPEDYPYGQRRVGFTWADDFRFNRIKEVLDALPKVSLHDSQQLQNDYVTLPGRRLIQVLRALPTSDPGVQDIVHWLTLWDHRVTAQSPQATLFWIWVRHHLGPALTATVVPESVRALLGMMRLQAILELLERPDQRLGSNPEQVRKDLMLQTLAAAVQELKQRQGPDRSTWQYGKLATVLFEHPLSYLADETLRLKMNVGPAPKAGDPTVVGTAWWDQQFRVRDGASFRMVLDVGEWDNSVAVNAPGQSGDPSSSHYRDLFPLWLNDEYFPLLYSRAAVEKQTERKIVLQPSADRTR